MTYRPTSPTVSMDARPAHRRARAGWLRGVVTGVTLTAIAATGMLSAITGAARPASAAGHLAQAATLPVNGASSLGVLDADPSLLSRDRAAGVGFATIDLNWSQWEPSPGVFDQSYIAAETGDASVYRQNGWTIAVDLGLEHAPAWVLNLRGGRLIDQNGVGSTTPDYEFSVQVRAAADIYIDQAVAALGTVQFYRIGLSENGEAYYPDVTNAGWWSAGAAQDSADHLPAGVGSTPLRGWIPGNIYYGHVATPTEVTAWYNWYFGAMVNAHQWEMNTIRAAGFSGWEELVMPGMGALPPRYNQRMAEALIPDSRVDPSSTLNSGAIWWKFLDALGSPTKTAVDISSVYDTSGSPQGNSCQAADTTVNYQTDPQISGWSSTRWLTYLATAHQLPVLGENSNKVTAATLAAAVTLAHSCGLQAFQWAQDHTLNGTGQVTATQLQTAWTTN